MVVDRAGGRLFDGQPEHRDEARAPLQVPVILREQRGCLLVELLDLGDVIVLAALAGKFEGVVGLLEAVVGEVFDDFVDGLVVEDVLFVCVVAFEVCLFAPLYLFEALVVLVHQLLRGAELLADLQVVSQGSFERRDDVGRDVRDLFLEAVLPLDQDLFVEVEQVGDDERGALFLFAGHGPDLDHFAEVRGELFAVLLKRALLDFHEAQELFVDRYHLALELLDLFRLVLGYAMLPT